MPPSPEVDALGKLVDAIAQKPETADALKARWRAAGRVGSQRKSIFDLLQDLKPAADLLGEAFSKASRSQENLSFSFRSSQRMLARSFSHGARRARGAATRRSRSICRRL